MLYFYIIRLSEEREMIKMIVSDVDGTLLSHGYINPKCIESIKKSTSERH